MVRFSPLLQGRIFIFPLENLFEKCCYCEENFDSLSVRLIGIHMEKSWIPRSTRENISVENQNLRGRWCFDSMEKGWIRLKQVASGNGFLRKLMQSTALRWKRRNLSRFPLERNAIKRTVNLVTLYVNILRVSTAVYNCRISRINQCHNTMFYIWWMIKLSLAKFGI